MDITGLNLQNPASFYMDNINMSSSLTTGQDVFENILRKTSANQNNDVPSYSSSNQPVDKTDKLYELCLELETFLVKNLLNSMRNTVQKSGLIDEGFAGKMYEDMLYDEYAKDFTKNANFGLAEQAYRQLTAFR